VKASVGHVVDLPKSKLGVDVDAGFAPDYHVIPGKTKVLAEIKAAAAKITWRFITPDYQGSALAEGDLPNSARMACSASLGGPTRRYCEYNVRSCMEKLTNKRRPSKSYWE